MANSKRSARVTSSKAIDAKQANGDPEIARRFTAKDLMLTFLIFFSVFGFVGYFRGRSLRNKPERLRWDVISRLTLGERNNEKALAYRCNGRNEVTWDVDGNKFINQRTLDKPTEEFTFTPAILNDETLIPAFLTGGGVASIFTAREILSFAASSGRASKLTDKTPLRLIVTAIVATVSGYELGHWIALRANYDCADARFHQILNDEKTWKGDGHGWSGFEKVYWTHLMVNLERREPDGFCQSINVEAKDAADKNYSSAKAQYIVLKESGVTSFAHDLTAADFAALRVYEKALDEFYRNCNNSPRRGG